MEVRNDHQQFFNYLNGELDRLVRVTVNYNDELATVALQETWLKIINSAGKYDATKASVKTWSKVIAYRCAIDALRAHYQLVENRQLNEKKENKNSAQLKSNPRKNNEADNASDDEENYSPPTVKALREVISVQDDLDALGKDLDNLVCPLMHTDDIVYEKQLQLAIKACIELLPNDGGPNYRQAMELCLDEDLRYADMTEILAAQSRHHANINLEQVRKWVTHAKIKMQACISQKLGWNNDRSKDRNNK
ncbi:RNA polymerase sigma factor [Undibacterium sp. RuRC25W]|uniref:RNA polymerase sigma factor n=1 Tax=Undibacterium sp. RuRC25W TaxID=3413047 RepID=UPI003BF2D140